MGYIRPLRQWGIFFLKHSEQATCRHLASRQLGIVLQPEIAAGLEFRPALGLVAPHFVDGIADQRHDMKLVEGDLGLGEVLAHASDVGAAHVDADLLCARCVGVVPAFHGCLVDRDALQR